MASMLFACTAADVPSRGVSNNVRDSAGIRIVETDTANLPIWSLVEPPEVEIGVVDGDSAYVLDVVNAAFRLDDGRIVLADGRGRGGGDLRLRFYDARGEYMRTVGRRGEGPGEFRDFGLIARLPGDSIVIFDRRARRFTTVTSTGVLAYTRSAEDVGVYRLGNSLRTGTGRSLAGPAVIGITRNGHYVVRYFRWGELETGYSRDTLFVFVMHPVDAAGGPLPPLPGREYVSHSRSMGRRVLPFSYEPVVVSWGAGVVAGNGQTYELRVYDTDGRLRMIMRLADPPSLELTEQHRRKYLDSGPAGWATTPTRMFGSSVPAPKEQLELLPLNHGVPAYTFAQSDDAGRLWVRDYAVLAHQQATSTWTIFESSGHAVARASLPTDLNVSHIASEHMVGVVRDSMRVEYVRVHRIRR